MDELEKIGQMNFLKRYMLLSLNDDNALAKALANYMFRQIIEDVHTKYKISDEEMKQMCKTAVDRAAVLTERLKQNVFTLAFQAFYYGETTNWDEPDRNEVNNYTELFETNEMLIRELYENMCDEDEH